MNRAPTSIAVALLAASAGTLSCNAIIGLSDATVRSGDAAVDAPVEAVSDASGTEPGTDADTSNDASLDATLDTAPDSTVPDSAAAVDAGPPPESAPPPALPWPVVIAVNASPDLPSFRVCFATASGMAPFRPLPETTLPGQTVPGVEPWAGRVLPDPVDPAGYSLTTYLVRADAIPVGSTDDCVQLLGMYGDGGSAGLVFGQDYWKLPDVITSQTIHDGTVDAVAVTGCLPAASDPGASAERCGQGYDSLAGNLGLKVFSWVPAQGDPTMVGARAVQASSAIDGVLSALAGEPVSDNVMYGVDLGGGQFFTIPMNLPPFVFGQLVPDSGTGMVSGLPMMDPRPSDVLAIQVLAPDGGTVAAYSPTLAEIAQATVATTTVADGGFYFALGETYTFVLVGDPSAAPDGGAQPHAMAFPDHLTSPDY